MQVVEIQLKPTYGGKEGRRKGKRKVEKGDFIGPYVGWGQIFTRGCVAFTLVHLRPVTCLVHTYLPCWHRVGRRQDGLRAAPQSISSAHRGSTEGFFFPSCLSNRMGSQWAIFSPVAWPKHDFTSAKVGGELEHGRSPKKRRREAGNPPSHPNSFLTCQAGHPHSHLPPHGGLFQLISSAFDVLNRFVTLFSLSHSLGICCKSVPFHTQFFVLEVPEPQDSLVEKEYRQTGCSVL